MRVFCAFHTGVDAKDSGVANQASAAVFIHPASADRGLIAFTDVARALIVLCADIPDHPLV